MKEELGLTVSIGVSFNKVFAKLGSDYKKPDAVTVFGRDSMESVIWKMPCDVLLLVGPRTQKTLEKFGLHTVGDIARMAPEALERMLGKQGAALWKYANGLDDSPVAVLGEEAQVKTIGNSTTLPHDITTEAEVRGALLDLAETVAARLRKHGVKAGEVQLTVRNANFEEYQRQRRVSPPVCDCQSLYRAALELYHAENKRWAIRLLGLRAGHLTGAGEQQLSLFSQEEGLERREQLEEAVDRVRARFGKDSVSRAMGLKRGEKP